MLTILMVLMYDYCKVSSSEDECPGVPLTRGNYLQLLISLETIVVLPILIVYLGKYCCS